MLTILTNTSPRFWTKNIHNFDQHISTIWANFDTWVSKIGRSLVKQIEQTSTLGVSKFGRSLVGIRSNTLTLHCVSFIYRASFDQTSTLGVSRFGRSFCQNFTTLRHWCRSLVEVSTKLRHQQIYTILNQTYLQSWFNPYSQFWSAIFTQFWTTNIHNFDQHIRIHNFDQQISTSLTNTFLTNKTSFDHKQNHRLDLSIVKFEVWLIIRVLAYKSKL